MAYHIDNISTACMVLEEIHRMDFSGPAQGTKGSRPQPFSLTEKGLSGEQSPDRPVLEGTALLDRLATLLLTLERGDGVRTRSCDRREKVLREELENSANVCHVWAEMRYKTSHEAARKLLYAKGGLADANQRLKDMKGELENAQRRLKEQEMLIKSWSPFGDVHKHWEAIFNRTLFKYEAMLNDEGFLQAKAIHHLRYEMVQCEQYILQQAGQQA